MKPYLKKEIIEGARAGGHGYREPMAPDYLQMLEPDLDLSFPHKEGMSKKYGYERKEQTDNLNPLWGFLRSRVGQKWDKVWSEVCEHNKDHMGGHLKRHLLQGVELNARINSKGEVTDSQGNVLAGYGWRRQDFYVDPRDGTLREISGGRPRYRYTEPKSKIVRLEGQDYYKHNGIWYRVTTEKAPEKQTPRYDYSNTGRHWLFGGSNKEHYWIPTDVFGRGGLWLSYHSMVNDLVKAYGIAIYCILKQQANKKECRKLNQLAKVA